MSVAAKPGLRFLPHLPSLLLLQPALSIVLLAPHTFPSQGHCVGNFLGVECATIDGSLLFFPQVSAEHLLRAVFP